MSPLLATIFVSIVLQLKAGIDLDAGIIDCESNKSCMIACDDQYYCGYANIICPLGHECNVTCRNDSCNQTTIYANESTEFNLYFHQNMYSELTIYLPISSTTNILPFFNIANSKRRFHASIASNKISLTLDAGRVIHPAIHSDLYGCNTRCKFSALSWSCIEVSGLCSNPSILSPHARRLLQSPTNDPTYAPATLNPMTHLEATLDNSINANGACNEPCNDEIDDVIQINVEYSFSDEVSYNMNNMECFLYKIFAKYNLSLIHCDIEITNIEGGTYNTFCEFGPCLHTNIQNNNNGNTTMTITTDDGDTYDMIHGLSLRSMEDEFQTQFMNIFGVHINVTIQLVKLDHVLWTLLKSINKLWFIVAALLVIFCCILYLLIWYICHTRKMKKKVLEARDKDRESAHKLQPVMPPHIQKLKHNGLAVPSKSREPITPSMITVSEDNYRDVRMNDMDDSGTDEDDVKPSSPLMAQVTPVPNQEDVISPTASSWHQSRTVHWQLQAQQHVGYNTQPQPPSALTMSSNHDLDFNMYKQMEAHQVYIKQQSLHNTKDVKNDMNDSSSDSLVTIQPVAKCSTPDTEENSQHFPSDDDDVVDKYDIKIDQVAVIDDDMILSDLESESGNHLNVNTHQPRQTTLEFRRKLTDEIMNTDTMMDDIVNDIANKQT
eukprot:37092_1